MQSIITPTKAPTAVYGLSEAARVRDTIKRLGIQEVTLLYDSQVGMWAVCQVKHQDTPLIMPDQLNTLGASIMWWCKDKDSKPRLPSEQDVNDVIATVHRAQHWFDNPGALENALDNQDKKKREATDAQIRERVQPHLKALKRAIREELG